MLSSKLKRQYCPLNPDDLFLPGAKQGLLGGEDHGHVTAFQLGFLLDLGQVLRFLDNAGENIFGRGHILDLPPAEKKRNFRLVFLG
jgi:hypothetical protein